METTGTKAARVIDTDRGEKLGEWACQNPACGTRVVVRTKSRWSMPPANPADRCSCTGCCFDLSGPHGTMIWVPAPSNVIPFPTARS